MNQNEVVIADKNYRMVAVDASLWDVIDKAQKGESQDGTGIVQFTGRLVGVLSNDDKSETLYIRCIAARNMEDLQWRKMNVKFNEGPRGAAFLPS